MRCRSVFGRRNRSLGEENITKYCKSNNFSSRPNKIMIKSSKNHRASGKGNMTRGVQNCTNNYDNFYTVIYITSSVSRLNLYLHTVQMPVQILKAINTEVYFIY